MFSEYANLLLHLTAKYTGQNLTDFQVRQFCRFGDMLLEWNQKMNLTRITEPKEIILKHFVDSMVLARHLEGNRVADLGTGAGFPGIPLKILKPELEMLLLDSLKKRLKFLDAVCRELQLSNVKTIHERVENIGRDASYRSSFDTVTARAVASLPVLSEYALPLLKRGGLFLAPKGPQAETELEESREALRLLGGELEKLEPVEMGENAENHVILIIRKKNDTPAGYPRKAGTPKKFPIL